MVEGDFGTSCHTLYLFSILTRSGRCSLSMSASIPKGSPVWVSSSHCCNLYYYLLTYILSCITIIGHCRSMQNPCKSVSVQSHLLRTGRHHA